MDRVSCLVLGARRELERIEGSIDQALEALALTRVKVPALNKLTTFFPTVDVVLAEVSKPSPSISFQLGAAIAMKVPVVYLALEGSRVPPVFIDPVKYSEDATRARLAFLIAKALERKLIECPPKSDRLDQNSPVDPLVGYTSYALGQVFPAVIVHVDPDGGFALLGDYGRKPAMLHASRMRLPTSAALEEEELRPGDMLAVRVVDIDPDRDQVQLEDLGEASDAEAREERLCAMRLIVAAWSVFENALSSRQVGHPDVLRWVADNRQQVEQFRKVRNGLTHGEQIPTEMLAYFASKAREFFGSNTTERSFNRWRQSEIVEGVVLGSDEIHGFTPNAGVLCDVVSDDGADPWDRAGPHRDSIAFTAETIDACNDCVERWRKMMD